MAPKDIFCLHETRTLNAHRRISLLNHNIEVPNVPLYEQVDIQLIPDSLKQTMEIRIWYSDNMVHSVTYPLKELSPLSN